MTDISTNSQPVVLITGAARRIGAAIAQILHSEGMRIGIHYRSSQDEAQALCEKLNRHKKNSACCLQGNLCHLPDIKRVSEQILDRFGRLDALVNNASGFYPTPIEQLDACAFDDLIASNLKGPAFLIQQLVPALRSQHGCIVNISDIYARQPLEKHPVYCAAKAGLEGLTRALALDLAPQIRVNAIAPGTILWPQSNDSMETKARSEIIDSIALKRIGHERDIAAAVLYLIRDAHYSTGQILTVDGGRR